MNLLIYSLLTFMALSLFSRPDFSDAERYYQSGAYEKSYELLQQLPPSPENLYNMGNTLFHLSASGAQQDILRNALSFYEASLKEQENTYTRMNYQYAKQFLKEEKQGQKQEQQSQEQQENKENQSSSGSEESSNSEKQARIGPQEREEQYILQEEEKLDAITEQERQKIESYIQEMKQEETQNRKYF